MSLGGNIEKHTFALPRLQSVNRPPSKESSIVLNNSLKMKANFALALLITLLTSALAAPTTESTEGTTLFPNLLIPIKQSTPDTAYFTQYTATISYSGGDTGNEERMIVGFDVPQSTKHNCAVSFVLPAPVPGGYPNAVNGSGKLDVYGFNGEIINGQTTWNNRPPRYPLFTPLWTISQPTNFSPATIAGSPIPCNHGRRMDFEVVATKGVGQTYFDWYELANPKTGVTLDMW